MAPPQASPTQTNQQSPAPEKFSFSKLKPLLANTYKEWTAVEAPRLGASLAYYTVLSLAPLLIVVIAIAGLVFGQEAASGALQGQIQGLVGRHGAEAIQGILKNAGNKKSSGVIASVLGFLALLFGASSVAIELRSAMNKIWEVKEEGGVSGMIKERSYALAVVLGAGFLLLVSLVVSASLASLGKFFGGLLPIPAWTLEALNSLVSFLVITGVLAAIFKFLPSVPITWRDVSVGALFTAALFTLGKSLIGIYLGRASVGSSYGAAGSLVVVLVWIYYSAQIFFFGAEFTRVYANAHGSRPSEGLDRQGAAAKAKESASKDFSKTGAEPASDGQPRSTIAHPSRSLAANAAITAGSAAALAVSIVKVFKNDTKPGT